ncbi:MAG: hypothetical protein HYW93_07880 [Thaumarchaeota archaeon]|nr:hypothetical protein [Nitrososphaerota archaeon]
MDDYNTKHMSRFLKVDADGNEDDAETRKLDKKVEETLKLIAQISSGAPDALVAIVAYNLVDAKGQPTLKT